MSNTVQPDPSKIGGVAEAPFVRLPDPGTLFADRAARLLALADGHVMGDYLRFLADVVRAQADAVSDVAFLPSVPLLQPVPQAEPSRPPLSEDQVRGNADLLSVLRFVCGYLHAKQFITAESLDGVVTSASENIPPAAMEAVASVLGMTDDEQLALASDIFGGSFPFDRVAESLFVAAALQVHLARLAAQLDTASIIPSGEGTCPVCGGAPVSSLVVGWTQANKARYCACSLCGTLWNHVRIKCTACGSTAGITYYTIEDTPKTIGIETCTSCRSYIKHMQQHEDTKLDPVADDVASYALDLLATNEDFRRLSINPLFLTG